MTSRTAPTTTAPDDSTARDLALAEVARRTLNIETLETRKMDALDFHDVAVWSVKEALEAAYAAGRAAAGG